MSFGPNSRSAFLPDEPINRPEQDRLNRIDLVKALGDKIGNYDTPDCLVIGIHGPWGSGKSSVLNLLASELEERSKSEGPPLVIVRFNPWCFFSMDQLILMFFHELGSALRMRSGSKIAKDIGTILETFGEVLSPAALFLGGPGARTLPQIIKTVGTVVRRSTRENNLFSLKVKLNRLLEDYGKKIVILVDDIDRLDEEGMRLMFRLIRLNADFNNTVYVLAFDRKVSEAVLESEQGVSGRAYLEKIIQVSFDLPLPEQSRIARILWEEMDEVLSGMPEEAWDEHRWWNLYHAGFKTFFRTIRDVKRYVNALRLTLPSVSEETNPVDFVALEAIRVFCPDVYSGLTKKREILTRTEGPYGSARSPDVGAQKREIEELLAKAGEDHETAVRGVCRQLFPQLAHIYDNTSYGPGWQSTWRKEKRICAGDVFYKYFLLGVPEGEISETEIYVALQKAVSRSAFAGVLRELIRRGLVRRFLERMQDFTKEFPVEKVETTIGALLDIGDELPAQKRGILDFGLDTQVVRVIRQLLDRIDDPYRRVEILKNVVETGAGLYIVVRLVSSIEPDAERERESIVPADGFKEIKTIVLERIRREASQENLSSMPNLEYILFRWRDWSTVDEPRDYVSRLVSSNQGLTRLFVGFLQETFSQSLRDYIPSRKWVISKKALSEFISPEDLLPKAQFIKQSQWTSLGERERLAVDAFLSQEREPLDE
ncbi:MAG: P-loop NTPase fold protein [Chloroflexota bacterium]